MPPEHEKVRDIFASIMQEDMKKYTEEGVPIDMIVNACDGHVGRAAVLYYFFFFLFFFLIFILNLEPKSQICIYCQLGILEILFCIFCIHATYEPTVKVLRHSYFPPNTRIFEACLRSLRI